MFVLLLILYLIYITNLVRVPKQSIITDNNYNNNDDNTYKENNNDDDDTNKNCNDADDADLDIIITV